MQLAALFIPVVLAVSGYAQLTMNPPGAGLTECQIFQLTWSGATGPVQVLVYPAGVSSGTPLETLPTTDGQAGAVNWLVDVPSGTSYTFALQDLTSGSTVFTAPASVAPNPSGDTSCEGKNGQTTTSPTPTPTGSPFMINTPGAGLTECQNFQLTWRGATGPVQILVFPAGVTSGTPLETLPAIPDGAVGSVDWLVDVPANVSYTFALQDLTSGQTVFSAAAFVSPNPSGDTSCEGGNGQTATSPTPTPTGGPLMLNTPGAGLTECQNFQLSWSGATGPVQILVFPAGVTSGTPLETLPVVNSGDTITWLVDVPGGTSYTFALQDLNSGQTVFTAPAFVSPNPSGDTSCEGKNGQATSVTVTTTIGTVTPTSTFAHHHHHHHHHPHHHDQ